MDRTAMVEPVPVLATPAKKESPVSVDAPAEKANAAVPSAPVVQDNRTRLNQLYLKVRQCQRCGLSRQRTKLVFGSGNPNATIMLVGEAPGFHEDQNGKPFVGDAGRLLDKILSAIQLNRDQVFITNVVKCRPPDNRDPLPEETDACFFMLQQQIDIVKPKYILILGRIAAHVVLKTDKTLAQLRGQVFDAFGAKSIVTYHPAALLRNESLKRDAWADVQLFQKLFKANG
ncbi:MAG: uracil-DNA glycosylase [Candidatus Zhuqueibacterota bacterium]